MSIFQDSFARIDDIFILIGNCTLGYHSMKFRHFSDISYFPKILNYSRSAVVIEAIRTISGLFIFLTKGFKRTKAQIKQKPTNKTKLSKQKTTKATVFWTYKNF